MGTWKMKAFTASRSICNGYRSISSDTTNGLPQLFSPENQISFQQRVKRMKFSSKNQVLSSKNSSVLVPLVLVGNNPSLLFTQRSLALNAHAGEVCYPLWLVKSPPWHMKLGITLWKVDPLYPYPFSPVHRERKFSAVFGTTSLLNSMTIRPRG